MISFRCLNIFKNYLPWLVVAFLLISGANTWAACSAYLDDAAFNEFYRVNNANQGGTASDFVEVKILDGSVPSSTYDGWEATICSDVTTGKGKNAVTTAECETFAISSMVDSYPWFYVQGSAYGDLIDYVDGFDAILVDGSGNTIDYVSVEGYTHQEDSGCSSATTTIDTGSSSRGAARVGPDGTGDWEVTNPGQSNPTPGAGNDPEAPPEVSINDVTVEAGNDAVFTISLQTAYSSDVTISYTTNNGTASAGSDYTAASGQATISASQLSTTVSISTDSSGSGTFTLDLSNLSEGSFLDSSGQATITESSGGTDHYSISHSGTGISCLAEDVTISAHDSSHTAVDADQESITVTAANNAGNWTLKTGGGSFSNGSSDDGEATYTFAAAETSVVLSYSYTGTGTFGFNVIDGSITENSGSAIASDDPDITFDTTEFRFIDSSDNEVIPTQIAGKASNIAPNADTLYLQAITVSDDNPTVCGAVFDPAETVDINFAAQCDNPTTCAGQTFSFTGNETLNIATNPASPATPASYTSVELLFGANAKAPFSFTYNDAGQMQLHASYTANTGAVLTGASNQFVVRPFAFGFPSITSGAVSNNAGDETGGDAFTSAGGDFDVDINAYLYQPADDADTDGIPDAGADVTDNGVTPNFTGTVSLSIDSYTPATGSTGLLSGAVSPLLDTYTNRSGADVTATLQYDEVGSFNLIAQFDNYLSALDTDIQSVATKIGRFYPDYFAISGQGVTAACSLSTDFTYMQQPFATFAYQVEARAANDQVAENYDLVLYTLGTATLDLQAEDSDNGVDLSGRVSTSESMSGWSSGVIDRTGGSVLTAVTFSRLGGDGAGLEDGPFNTLQLGLKLESEPDSRDFTGSDKNMQASSTGSCGVACDAVEVGSTQVVRYGRLYIQSAHGPENEPLTVPFSVQYWNGASFVTSIDDGCSAIPLSNITFDGNSIDSVANRMVTVGGGTTTGSLGISGTDASPTSGDYGLQFSAPGAGNTGYFNIGISNVPDWLRYDWDQNGSADDSSMPDALITFGRARGNDRMIFWQERYQ